MLEIAIPLIDLSKIGFSLLKGFVILDAIKNICEFMGRDQISTLTGTLEEFDSNPHVWSFKTLMKEITADLVEKEQENQIKKQSLKM